MKNNIFRNNHWTMYMVAVFFISTHLFGCATASLPNERKDVKTGNVIVEKENIPVSSTILNNPVWAQEGDEILILGNPIQYMDPTISSDLSVYCTKPGCKHNDEDCPANINKGTSFINYHGVYYYIKNERNDLDTHYLIEFHPDTLERKTLLKCEGSSDDESYLTERIGIDMISHGKLLYTLEKDRSFKDPQRPYETYIAFMMMDLETKESKMLFDNLPQNVYCFFIGGNEEKIYYERVDFENKKNSIFSYCYSDGEIKELVSENEGMIQYHLPYFRILDGKIIWYTDHMIHVYDFEQEKECETYEVDERILEAGLFGNYIYYSSEIDDVYNNYFIERDTKKIHHWKSVKKDDPASFPPTPRKATENGMLMFGEEGWFWISYKDVIAGNDDGFVQVSKDNC